MVTSGETTQGLGFTPPLVPRVTGVIVLNRWQDFGNPLCDGYNTRERKGLSSYLSSCRKMHKLQRLSAAMLHFSHTREGPWHLFRTSVHPAFCSENLAQPL